MLVLFQTFLMMARSSSLACSKLPGAMDRPGQQHLTGPPLAQQMVAGFSMWWLLPWADFAGGERLLCPWGSPASGHVCPRRPGFQHPEWLTAEAVPSCTPYRPRTVISPPHTWSVPLPPGSPPGALPWPPPHRPLAPPPSPASLSLPSGEAFPAAACCLPWSPLGWLRPSWVPMRVRPPHRPPPCLSSGQEALPQSSCLKAPQAHASHTNTASSRPTSIRAGCVRTEAG